MRHLALVPVAVFACLLPLACSRPANVLDTEDAASPAPVRLEKAARAPFQPTLTLLGVVRPAATAEVAAPAAGRLSYPGRFAAGLPSGAAVRAGEVIARLATPDMELAVAEARLRVDSSRSELERHQRVFDAGLISAAQLAPYKVEAALAAERLGAAEKELARLSLRAPVSGLLLVESRVPPGTEVAPGTVLARIAAGGALRVEGRAAAADLPRLHEGQRVRFVPPGGEPMAPMGEATIREVSPVVDAGGTVLVVAEVRDPTGLPAPGEGVELRVELDLRAQALTVPDEALVVTEGGNAVFVAARRFGAVIAKRRAIETGARGGGRVEVLRGLSPGDRVVVEGAAMLTENAKVVEIEEPLAPEANLDEGEAARDRR